MQITQFNKILITLDIYFGTKKEWDLDTYLGTEGVKVINYEGKRRSSSFQEVPKQ